MLKVLIGVDGSEHSTHAIEAVATLAKASMQLEVVLLNVREAPLLFGDLPSLSLEQIEDAQKKLQGQVLDAAFERARACGLTVASKRRAQGLVAPEIVRVATECGADQIVLGTRGMGALGSLFIGSVAQRVVHLATVPVLLVK
jgi:nucleotide-binding universal stress UspA family protein